MLGGDSMSMARSFLRMAKKYEWRMKYLRENVIKNRAFHITQLSSILSSLDVVLDLTYDELESWTESMQEVFEVDEFDHWYEKIELVFLKKYVVIRYNNAFKDITGLEDAKKSLADIKSKLEVLDAFVRH